MEKPDEAEPIRGVGSCRRKGLMILMRKQLGHHTSTLHKNTMGLRASVVVCVTSFLLGDLLLFFFVQLISFAAFLGSLFTHWIADSLTLWKSPVTDEHLWTAALYYSILTKGPVQILYILSAIVILGGATIFWSFRDGEAGNLMFDGGSICAQHVP